MHGDVLLAHMLWLLQPGCLSWACDVHACTESEGIGSLALSCSFALCDTSMYANLSSIQPNAPAYIVPKQYKLWCIPKTIMFAGLRRLAHSRDASSYEDGMPIHTGLEITSLNRCSSSSTAEVARGASASSSSRSESLSPTQTESLFSASSTAWVAQELRRSQPEQPYRTALVLNAPGTNGLSSPSSGPASNQHHQTQQGLDPSYAKALEYARGQQYDVASAAFEDLLQQQPGHVKAWISYAQVSVVAVLQSAQVSMNQGHTTHFRFTALLM